MKFAWRNNIIDLAAWNSGKCEEINLDEYREILEEEELANNFNVPDYFVEDLD
jgi:hypothetical protein